MINMKKNILGIIELLLAAVLTAGSVTFLSACEAEEGHFMNCHWAQNAVTLMGSVLAVSALLRILLPNKGIKAGISLTIALFSAGTALIPKTLINLCMMQTMRCHTLFRPGVIVISLVLTVLALTDAIVVSKKPGDLNEHKKADA